MINNTLIDNIIDSITAESLINIQDSLKVIIS
jgi:hypothetical protein